MAAVSGPHAASVLTPPSSSHETQSSWNFSVPAPNQNGTRHNANQENEPLSTSARHDIHTNNHFTRPELSQKRMNTYGSANSSRSSHAAEQTFLAPARISALYRKDSNISETGSAPDSLLDLYGTNSANRSAVNSIDMGERKAGNGVTNTEDEDLERSRWIHRDKLARIESQELEAAGIILPRSRASSRPAKRDRSRDQHSGGGSRSEPASRQQTRHRIESQPTEEEDEAGSAETHNWDLRTPEEAAADYNEAYVQSNGLKGNSRIPIFRTSPLPIPQGYIERDTPMQRRKSNGWTEDDDTLTFQKSRGRSQSIKMLDDAAMTPTPAKRVASDVSPKKNPSALRKGSGANSRAPSAQSRPATRSGPRAASASQRPPTRSGETKRPEGDPPWLATMYKPDPRLPPDQQLLPTVAKRLQQEQWEKEGKFGTAYDREFRPLNDEEFHQPPEIITQTIEAPEQGLEDQQWPLRSPKSPTLSTGRPTTAGGYSTMPKIQGSQQTPVTSPRPIQVIRVQEPLAEYTKKKGCGCIVM